MTNSTTQSELLPLTPEEAIQRLRCVLALLESITDNDGGMSTETPLPKARVYLRGIIGCGIAARLRSEDERARKDEHDHEILAPLGHALSSVTSSMRGTPEVKAVWDAFWKLNAKLLSMLPVRPAPKYKWADDSEFLAGAGMIAGRCDYRYDGCANDGEVVNGVWTCRNHLNPPLQPAASTPTEAGVCPECQGRAGLDFHDEGCGFDRSGKGETAVVLAHCTWKPTLIRCVKCSHRGDSRRVVYCPTCGCKCEFEPAASTEAKCKRCNGTGEVEGYGGNLIYCGSCAGTGKTFESQLTDFAASTEGQDESGCSNKFCTDGWVDKERGTQDGTESWVEQVPCQVCGIHCDPGPTAPASYAERAKKLVSDAIKRRVAGGSVVSRPWELIDNIAEFASAVAMETRLEGQVEMQEMIVNALGDVKNPCDVEGVDIKSDFSGGFERARVESIQAVRALSPDPNYREKLKDGERERIANSIIALHRRIYGTTELDEYNEGLNISDVLAAIESKEQPTLSDILTELEIAEIEAQVNSSCFRPENCFCVSGDKVLRLIATYKLLAAERDEWKYDYNVMLEQRDVAREREEESAREYNADIERLKDQVRSLQQERDNLKEDAELAAEDADRLRAELHGVYGAMLTKGNENG